MFDIYKPCVIFGVPTGEAAWPPGGNGIGSGNGIVGAQGAP